MIEALLINLTTEDDILFTKSSSITRPKTTSLFYKIADRQTFYQTQPKTTYLFYKIEALLIVHSTEDDMITVQPRRLSNGYEELGTVGILTSKKRSLLNIITQSLPRLEKTYIKKRNFRPKGLKSIKKKNQKKISVNFKREYNVL